MKELKFQKKIDIHLNPGELYIAETPTLIKTILGSCISMIFYCDRLGISGITHAQLPGKSNTDRCYDHCPAPCGSKDQSQEAFKYVTSSTQYMLNQFKAKKIMPHEIEIKLFGGANVLKAIHSLKTVGEKNITASLDIIEQYRLRLTAEDTGGNRGRTLYLFSHSGEVRVFTHKN
ncbi:MAG: chemotaxis protein CheD [Proteobacteria bacterium]|nr:chemotaxis protein CheD [Pseudomonadota bacterium]